jgi:hypothetical protein
MARDASASRPSGTSRTTSTCRIRGRRPRGDCCAQAGEAFEHRDRGRGQDKWRLRVDP